MCSRFHIPFVFFKSSISLRRSSCIFALFCISLYRLGEMERIIILFLTQEQKQKIYPPISGGSNGKEIDILFLEENVKYF